MYRFHLTFEDAKPLLVEASTAAGNSSDAEKFRQATRVDRCIFTLAGRYGFHIDACAPSISDQKLDAQIEADRKRTRAEHEANPTTEAAQLYFWSHWDSIRNEREESGSEKTKAWMWYQVSIGKLEAEVARDAFCRHSDRVDGYLATN